MPLRSRLSLIVVAALLLAACGDGTEAPGPVGSASTNPGRVQFSSPIYNATENQGNVTVTVTRTDGLQGEVGVRLRTMSGTATSPADYGAVSVTISFADGETIPKSVSIPVVDDSLAEGNETLQLILDMPTGDVVVGTGGAATLAIEDDEVPPPLAPRTALSVTTRQIRVDWTEGAGATSYLVLYARNPQSDYAQIGSAQTAGTRTLEFLVSPHLFDWKGASVVVRACNAGGCTDSLPASFPDGPAASAAAMAYLKAAVVAPSSYFGSAVALSGNGNTLVVSAPYEDSGGTGVGANPVSDCNGAAANCKASSGAVYVFSRATDGSWTQTAFLKASNSQSFANFGSAVAISKDGNTIAVGAYSEDSAAIGVNGSQVYNCNTGANCASASGAVYVFTRSGSTWTQQAYAKATNTSSGAYYGARLALSANGSRLAVGAVYESSARGGLPDCNAGAPTNCVYDSGAVYLLTRSGTSWSTTGLLKATFPRRYNYFGQAIDLSEDGNQLAVGTGADGSTGSGTSSSPANDCDGAAINCRSYSGAAYVYDIAGVSPVLTAFLKASNPAQYAYFGTSVSINDAGTRLVVGASGESSTGPGPAAVLPGDCDIFIAQCYDSGAAYVFDKTPGGWTQLAFLKATNAGENDNFGSEVELSGDGRYLAVSAPEESGGGVGVGSRSDENGQRSGAAYLFDLQIPQSAQSRGVYLKAKSQNEIGQSLALSTDGSVLVVGAPGDDSPVAGLNPSPVNDCGASTPTRCASSSGAIFAF
jgi:hypothetical protein